MKKPLVAFALGVIALGAARFVLAPLNQTTHHHANWAILVDGERIDLSGCLHRPARHGEHIEAHEPVHAGDADGR